MPSETSEIIALLHIRDAIKAAQDFVKGMDFDTFDQKTFFAATRALEIISEASRRLTPALKVRHSHIPWTDIAGSGNIYRHDYEDVAERYVWQTVHDSLPDLQKVVAVELSQVKP
jgi:uncharacterized protein with HEPN domain